MTYSVQDMAALNCTGDWQHGVVTSSNGILSWGKRELSIVWGKEEVSAELKY